MMNGGQSAAVMYATLVGLTPGKTKCIMKAQP